VQSIDASSVDRSLLGHSYFADSSSVLSDIHAVVMDHEPPGERPQLTAIDVRGSGTYWQFASAQRWQPQ
jgi:hypothetical protein